MRIFAIRDELDKRGKDLAYLIYYEKNREFFVELPESCDPWEVPLLLSTFARKKIYSVDSTWSRIWVQQRIIPPERQNIGQILKDNKLKEYDEYKMLMLSMGRCEQDDYYLVPVSEEEIPGFLKERNRNTIEAVFPLSAHKILAFFQDGSAKKYDAEKTYQRLCRYYKQLQPESLFKEVEVSTGGRGIQWGSEVSLSKEEIYDNGEEFPLSLQDIRMIAENSFITSSEATKIIGCSRQNIDDLVKREKLNPVKKIGKTMLFLKDEVQKRIRE